MGLFDSIIGGASDLVQGSLGDVIGGEIPCVQEAQDLVGGVAETATNATEAGTTAVEDIGQNLGL